MPYKPYSSNDLEIINNPNFDNKQAAALLGRSEDRIRAKRYFLNNPIKRQEQYEQTLLRATHKNNESQKAAYNNGQPWSSCDDEVVLSTLKEPEIEVAETLGRTIQAVNARRVFLTN